MAKTKIQLVLEDEVRQIGEKLAQNNGMNSYQDLIRYWTVQASKGNLEVKHNFIEEEIMTPEMEKHLRKLEKEFKKAEKEGKVKSFNTVEKFFQDLGI